MNDTGLVIGTLNCRGIQSDIKKMQLANDMVKYKIYILAIQETHIKENSMPNITAECGKNFSLHLSGNRKDGKPNSFAGVGFVTR